MRLPLGGDAVIGRNLDFEVLPRAYRFNTAEAELVERPSDAESLRIVDDGLQRHLNLDQPGAHSGGPTSRRNASR